MFVRACVSNLKVIVIYFLDASKHSAFGFHAPDTVVVLIGTRNNNYYYYYYYYYYYLSLIHI